MPETRSINQNIPPKLLPDFRNMGTVLRIVLLTNGVALLELALHAESFPALLDDLLQTSALLQPVLLACLLVLYTMNDILSAARPWQAALIVSGVVAAITLALDMLGGELLFSPEGASLNRYTRHALVGAIAALLLLAYFRLRSQALAPAGQEARLQALQARIRPHFLFNTINAVLSIVRADPKRAETALEDMSDLFRMTMADPHELVPLEQEIELARQYLSIEQLRLGERLKVQWDTEGMPQAALIPPLVLQPLLENAVYHGIEPLPEGGTITVQINLDGNELHLDVLNPALQRDTPHTNGHRMALSNIRERLALLFDVEALYTVERTEGHYRVHIVIPHVKKASA